MSSRPKPLAAGALSSGPTLFAGYTVRETAAAAATIRIFDNAAAGTGTLIAAINLASGGSDLIYGCDIYAENGLFAVITGTVEGSIYIA